MELYLAAGITGLALIILLLLGFRLVAALEEKRGRALGSRDHEKAPEARKPGPGACPLCSSILAPGERVKSDLAPGKGDRIMRIFGCPHCMPQAEEARGQGRAARTLAKRFCPVCGRELEPGGFAVARYFEKPGRKHIHVLGCTSCRPAAKGV
jgi:RNase P subunit RPR2